jgi:hypothetical protein
MRLRRLMPPEKRVNGIPLPALPLVRGRHDGVLRVVGPFVRAWGDVAVAHYGLADVVDTVIYLCVSLHTQKDGKRMGRKEKGEEGKRTDVDILEFSSVLQVVFWESSLTDVVLSPMSAFSYIRRGHQLRTGGVKTDQTVQLVHYP